MALKEIEKLKEKVEKDPNSKLFVPLAEEYKKEGMLDEAIQVLLTGIERQPGYMSARVSLGKIYLEKDMRDEARSEFENVIRSIPDNLYAHKKLAEIYRDSGEREMAVRSYKTILRLNAMDEDALASLHELEEGKPSERVTEQIPGGRQSSEEDLLEGHVYESPTEEEIPADTQLEGPDAGPFEEARENDLNAFKESLFGSGDAEDDTAEEIIPEDLPEEDANGDSPYFPAGEPVGDVSADVEAEGDIAETEEISWEDEEVLTEAVSGDQEDLSADDYAAVSTGGSEEDVGEDNSGSLEVADGKVSEGDYGGAARMYRKLLSDNPDDRKALQRLEELRSLLKMLGKDKEELIARLNGFLDGIQERRDEFFGRT